MSEVDHWSAGKHETWRTADVSHMHSNAAAGWDSVCKAISIDLQQLLKPAWVLQSK